MIWSFVKFALFFGIVAVVAFGASYVMDTGGDVTVAFGGREIRKSPIEALILLAAAFVGIYLLFRLAGLLIAVWRWMLGDETAFSRYFDRNREKRGYQALGDSVIALAAGDGRTAMVKAAKADKLIDRPEITGIVSAQAAQITGDTAKAEAHFKALLTDDRTRFVGIQGLLGQKLEEGDTDTAMKLAEKAFAVNPRHDPTMETLFALQSDKKDWAGARETLQARVRAKALPKDIGQRRDAILSTADAFAEMEAGKKDLASTALAKAIRIAPGFVPAAVAYGALLIENGDKRKATKMLKKAWELNPHPDLAATFAAIEPDETHDQRMKRFKPFMKLLPEHAETQMLEAELHLAAEDFPAARKAIGDLPETDPTARSLSIIAAVERGSGADEAVVSGWLARALSAPRGDAWICDSCKHIHASWNPTCENCASFDTLGWKRVPANEDTRTMEAVMLPLMAGKAVTDHASEPPAQDPVQDPVQDKVEDVAEEIIADANGLKDVTPEVAVAEGERTS